MFFPRQESEYTTIDVGTYYLQKESIHDVPQTSSNIYEIVDFTHHSLHYIIVYQQFDYNFDIIPYLSVHSSSLETIEYVKAVNLNILYSVDDDYMKYEGFFW